MNTLTATAPAGTYAAGSPLRAGWTYPYDGLGNRTRAGALVSFYDNAPAPQRVQAVTPGGAVSHDPSGSVTGLPALGAAAPRTLNYDAEGRLAMVTGGGAAVRFVHDARGQRVARIVNEGAAGEQVTVYYGRWFEVTGGTLTRHIYLGERRIGHSPVAAPSGLTLARGYDGERAVVLARAMEAAERRDGWARPRVAVEAAEAAAALTVIAGVGLVLIVVRRRWWDEGTRSPEYGRRVRLGMVGRLARGPLVLVVVVLVSALLPWPRLRVVWAGSVSPPPVPPSYPVYFAHTDHLGSTLLLTCHLAGAACPDGTVARRFRYNAYGQPAAYTASGQSASLTAAVPGSDFVPEHLYTGQRWVSAAALYDYGARFYDPQLVQFVSQDPVR
ncbi:hypothetical protein L6Q96_05840, partial [Candidatus Binatia bacterium]|nr:hypothetical protein [Candidatus Binatia bacterium]